MALGPTFNRNQLARLQVVFAREDDRNPMVNVVHVGTDGPMGSGIAEDAIQLVRTVLVLGTDTAAGVDGFIEIVTRAELRSITAYSVEPGGTPSTIYAHADLDDSLGSVTTLPPQISMVASLRTATPGRSGRGRIFVGSLTQGLLQADGRVATGSAEGLAQTVAAACDVSTHNAGNVELVVYSPTLGEAYNITHVVVDNGPDVQRSRGQEPTAVRQASVPLP